MSEVGNQFKSQKLSQLITSSINTVGGRVFPDPLANNDLMSLNNVVNAWRSTHAQAYGNALPNTGTATVVNPSDTGTPVDLIVANDNEVVLVNALSGENGGSGSITFQILLGDTLVKQDTLGSAALQGYTSDVKGLIVSKGQELRILVTSGTAADLIVNASSVKTCI
tara:strand:- start:660 stop:1160 length:501 start_codon:yes stop_codon:yes gene_type:complete